MLPEWRELELSSNDIDLMPARPRITTTLKIAREACLYAGLFTADQPYMSVLDKVEPRVEQREVWVGEASGTVVAAVTLTFAERTTGSGM